MRSARDPALAEVMRGAGAAWHAWLMRLLAGEPDADGWAAVIMSTMRRLFMLPGASQSERTDRRWRRSSGCWA